MYFNCNKNQVKEDWEIIKEYIEDVRKNMLFMTEREQLAVQCIELYINDSTPNCYIRDSIKEMEDTFNENTGHPHTRIESSIVKSELNKLLEKE